MQDLVERDELTVVPGVFDALTVKLAEDAGLVTVAVDLFRRLVGALMRKHQQCLEAIFSFVDDGVKHPRVVSIRQDAGSSRVVDGRQRQIRPNDTTP
jgi:hypothetical protein